MRAGSREFFNHYRAGKDAARAYGTGCFQTHLTHDLRGLTESEMRVRWPAFFSLPPRASRCVRARVRWTHVRMLDTGRRALEEVLHRLEEVPQGGACLASPDRPCEPLAGALRSEEGRGGEGTRAAGRTSGSGEAPRALMHAWRGDTSESQLSLSALSHRNECIQVTYDIKKLLSAREAKTQGDQHHDPPRQSSSGKTRVEMG